jgi:hypothetical protein
MTNDSSLFKTAPGDGRLSLFEGKMIHQYAHQFAEPRYWLREKDGRAALIGSHTDTGKVLPYQDYRLGFRDIARSTDARTMIAAILPRAVFAGNTLNLVESPEHTTTLFLSAVMNSFAADYILRLKVTAHCNMFYIYQLPVPRLTRKDAAFAPIVERAARLICTTPEFDDLAKEVGLGSHRNGVKDPAKRARIRAELDGLVAHLYGLTEDEFAYILTTFPLVDQSVKDAALQAYRDVGAGRIV